LGELLQTDATPFAWFGDGRQYALHALIDDATGAVTGMYLTLNECAEGYFCVIKQTVENFGVPLSFYADGLGLFFGHEKPTIEEQLEGKMAHETQFAAILRQLGSNLIHARSPEAKGRVERLWETLQSRLPVEFDMRGINDVDTANAFLADEYVGVFNKRFAVPPVNGEPAFMPRPKGIIFDRLLSMRYTRVVDKSGCFSLNGYLFQTNMPGLPPKAKITVLVNKRIGLKAEYNGSLSSPLPLFDKEKRQVASSSVAALIEKFVHECCLKNEHAA
jgi:hypothetical protein